MREVNESEVTERSGRPGKYWLLKCDCGTEKIAQGISFYYGQKQSCGCLQHGPAHNRKALGEAAKWAAYTQTIVQNKKRKKNIPWELAFEQFLAIVTRPCRYCGIEWSKEIGNREGKGATFGSFQYNGIDRIDSAKGYAIGNCAPACKTCNFAKNAMSEQEFKAWLTRAYEHFVAGSRNA